MKNYGYYTSYGYNSDKPISSWGYVGFNILWAIPVVGWLIWLWTALFSNNQNKKSYARSFVCGFILIVLVVAVVAIAFVALYALGLIDLSALTGGSAA